MHSDIGNWKKVEFHNGIDEREGGSCCHEGTLSESKERDWLLAQ